METLIPQEIISNALTVISLAVIAQLKTAKELSAIDQNVRTVALVSDTLFQRKKLAMFLAKRGITLNSINCTQNPANVVFATNLVNLVESAIH
jgi:hypothetical protein